MEDFRKFATVLTQVRKEGKIVVQGPSEAVEKANAEHADLLEMIMLI